MRQLKRPFLFNISRTTDQSTNGRSANPNFNKIFCKLFLKKIKDSIYIYMYVLQKENSKRIIVKIILINKKNGRFHAYRYRKRGAKQRTSWYYACVILL